MNCSFFGHNEYCDCSIYVNDNIPFVLNSTPTISSPNGIMNFRLSGNFNGYVRLPNTLTNCYQMFAQCYNFNQPVNIPELVNNCRAMFFNCYNMNAPVNIGNNVTDCGSMFFSAYHYNQPVNIPDSVTDCTSMLAYCGDLNCPVVLGNNVTDCGSMFLGCSDFNQSIILPESVESCQSTFLECFSFNQPIIIPNNVPACFNMFNQCFMFNQNLYIPDSVGLNYTNVLTRAFAYNSTISIPTIRNDGYSFPPFDLFGKHAFPYANIPTYGSYTVSTVIAHIYNNYRGDRKYFNNNCDVHTVNISTINSNGIKIIVRDRGSVAELVDTYVTNDGPNYILRQWLFEGTYYNAIKIVENFADNYWP